MDLVIWESIYDDECNEGYIIKSAFSKTYDFSVDNGVEDFVKVFLIRQNKYPLYISFEACHWDYQYICDDLNEANIMFRFELVPQKSSYTIDDKGKKLFYDLPIFTVEVQRNEELIKVFEISFHFAKMNFFYAISNQNNLSFEVCTRKESWNNKVNKTNYPHFTMNDSTTFFVITSDAMRATMVTDEFVNLEQLIEHIPQEIIIRQINEDLID